jgi:hypothetical protein
MAEDIFVDLIATAADPIWIKRIVGYKRFTLMFGIGKGLFTPIPKPPGFFENYGGGEESLWVVELSATDSSSFTDVIAADVIRVYINEEAKGKFGRLCNAGVAGDLLSRLFVVDVISETLVLLLRICPELPESNLGGSIAAKLLPKLNLNDSGDYIQFRERALANPSSIRTRVQDLFKLTSTVRSSTR